MVSIVTNESAILKCPLCGDIDYSHIYSPHKSTCGAKVYLCSRCAYLGLAPTKVSDYRALRLNVLSCDADYSSVRVGKEQMLENSWNLISTTLDLEACRTVLDLSSARGHFAKKVLTDLKQAEITCLEPDLYMTDDYPDSEKLKIIHSARELEVDKTKFDLVYSCHSLEHYRDPLRNIGLMATYLNDKGSIYLEVPNASSMNSKHIVEEFFYDQHRSYFYESVLTEAIKSVGLEVRNFHSDSSVMRFVLNKSSRDKVRVQAATIFSESVRSQVISYSERLSRNRKDLPSIVNGWGLDRDSKSLGIVGCGRMLDALITYGGLNVDNSTHMFDSFLSKIEYFKRGNRVKPLLHISESQPDQVVIAANSSATGLFNLVKELSPNSKIFIPFLNF